MLPCAEFEDRLSGYDELVGTDRAAVDSHVTGCSGCREFFETLAELDAGLTALYGGVRSRGRVTAEAVRKPSAWPEVLDFCGWAAVVTAIVLALAMVAGELGIRLMLPS